MEKETLKNKLLLAYKALKEYEKYSDRAQKKHDKICSRMRKKRKKDNWISSIKAGLIVYLVISLLLILGNAFAGDLAPTFFGRLFAASSDVFKFFTFQVYDYIDHAILSFTTIAYILLFIMIGWFHEHVFKEESIECDDLMEIYRDDSDFEEELNDYAILLEEADKFWQIEQFQEDINFISNKYQRANSVARLFNYLADGRADDLKEAINLYELETRQERLEGKLDGYLEQLRRIEVAVNNAENAARRAEISASYRDYIDVNIRYK